MYNIHRMGSRSVIKHKQNGHVILKLKKEEIFQINIFFMKAK